MYHKYFVLKKDKILTIDLLFSCGATTQIGPMPPLLNILDHIQLNTHTHTSRKTPLDELSVRQKDVYLTTLDNHNRQTSMPSAEFETAIPKSERPQTHALDRPATGIGE